MIPYNFQVKLQILILASNLRIQQPAYNFEASTVTPALQFEALRAVFA